MFGIDAEKLFVPLIIGMLVLSPDKLPEYAATFGRLVRELRRMAAGAQEQLLGNSALSSRTLPAANSTRASTIPAGLSAMHSWKMPPGRSRVLPRSSRGPGPPRAAFVAGQTRAPFDSEAT